MPRADPEKRARAEKLYIKGMLPVEISKKLGIPQGTIRSWKQRGKWDEKKARKKTDHVATIALGVATPKPRKGGAPKGSRNAAGNHTPGGNPHPEKNALKHGVYSNPYWDFLEDGEMEVAESVQDSEEQMYIDQIALFSIRERRIMKAMKVYRSDNKVYIDSAVKAESKRAFESEEEEQAYNDAIQKKVESGDRLPGNQYQLTTYTQNVDNMLLRWERELSTVQRAKTAAVDALAKLRIEKAKAEEAEHESELVLAWTQSVLSAREVQKDE